jgi:uncharacterized RmlC-like cupin family protein
MSPGAGIQVVRSADLSDQTAQTPGMVRRTAIDAASVGARTLWVGRVTTDPGMKSGAHHHGDSESAIFVVSGHVRMLFGDGLAESVDAGPGDYIYVPPNCIHVEMNASNSEPAEAIVIRDSQENIVVAAEAAGS